MRISIDDALHRIGLDADNLELNVFSLCIFYLRELNQLKTVTKVLNCHKIENARERFFFSNVDNLRSTIIRLSAVWSQVLLTLLIESE